jgi:hypothetical protein
MSDNPTTDGFFPNEELWGMRAAFYGILKRIDKSGL